ncbi:hypothetical protein ACIGJO_15325 [Streptomyces sp. NPDC079020]|uniref:hypothetical protein n=1 Tax=Streptomyces sp. NPDC079020 TaxID=3365722 RepID=UPI0037CF4C70
MKAARVELLIHRDDVLRAYRDGASLLNLCRTWQVDPRWLTTQFDAWGEPRRDRSAAAIARGPGIPPRSARSARSARS